MNYEWAYETGIAYAIQIPTPFHKITDRVLF